MCSAITHVLVGAAVGMLCQGLWPRPSPSDDLVTGLARERELRLRSALPLGSGVLSALPDLDVGMHAFVPYSHPLGHRGAFHSLGFYLLAALVLAFIVPKPRRPLAFLCALVSLSTHSLLDMMTNGGLGIALFWPLTNERLFFGWRPFPVSSMSVSRFLSEQAPLILAYELPPALAAVGLAAWIRRRLAPAG